jgi:hypothetical protein
MAEPLTIGIGSNKWVKDANTKMMTLHGASSSGTLSMHDDTGVDYQVPVGKKFIILSIQSHSGGQYSTGGSTTALTSTTISKSTVTDTAGTPVYTVQSLIMRTANSGQGMAYSQPSRNVETYIEIPASNYIVSGNPAYVYYGHQIGITGVETDV